MKEAILTLPINLNQTRAIVTALAALLLLTQPANCTEPEAIHWEACGWGGGGCFWSGVFHPTKEGVIYMGGDVAGAYKSDDFGKQWRFINNGLASPAVYSMAVDVKSPETVYAATTKGLCKSTNGGEQWMLCPETGPKQLRITGERGKSIRAVAVDPTDSSIVFAGSPGGKIYKSTDGAQTWKAVYEPGTNSEEEDVLRIQFGKVTDAKSGGVWINNPIPKGMKAEECDGIGISIKGDGSERQNVFLSLNTADGATYRSKDIGGVFKETDWRDIALKAVDFAIDPEFAKSKPDIASTAPATPNFTLVQQASFSASGLSQEASSIRLRRFFSVLKPAGESIPDPASAFRTGREFSKDKKSGIGAHGNARADSPSAGGVYSVAVNPRKPSQILGCTATNGIVLSDDGGSTWTALKTPKRAGQVMVAPGNENIFYGAFFEEGVHKSVDGGKTWTPCGPPSLGTGKVIEVVVSSADPNQIYCTSTHGYAGKFFASGDGGQTWTENSRIKPNYVDNPTLPDATPGGMAKLNRTQNLVISPSNPNHLFAVAEWRPVFSADGGKTWVEHSRGADISCVSDLRFGKNRVYVTAMDEGCLMSENEGGDWKQLWPRKFEPNISGHAWRVAILPDNGGERILTTLTPWNKRVKNNVVVISDDGGKTYRFSETGLPNYIPVVNVMWGKGYMRALAVDPGNPNVVYAGIDGDPQPGKSGGGIFKSEDGGIAWKQLPNQPAGRKMFYGLAVDPTDSARIYWASVDPQGGLYRSEDGGNSWVRVFSKETSIFNVHVAKDGTVYCPGKNLWRSKDHGQTWKKISDFKVGKTLVGLEVDPQSADTVWVSSISWSESPEGAVYKTTDGGVTWQNITGNIPWRCPLILRLNPATRELWAAGVGIYKTKGQ